MSQDDVQKLLSCGAEDFQMTPVEDLQHCGLPLVGMQAVYGDSYTKLDPADKRLLNTISAYSDSCHGFITVSGVSTSWTENTSQKPFNWIKDKNSIFERSLLEQPPKFLRVFKTEGQGAIPVRRLTDVNIGHKMAAVHAIHNYKNPDICLMLGYEIGSFGVIYSALYVYHWKGKEFIDLSDFWRDFHSIVKELNLQRYTYNPPRAK